ncbi:hypothetical protein ACXYMO_07825 [Arenibacterium sp. CAU 1754]
MLVTDIEITHYQYCQKSARHIANVCVTLKNQIVTLLCRLDLPEDECGQSRAVAFVDDAIRQLRRMPEVRSGRQELQFAESLTPVPAHISA